MPAVTHDPTDRAFRILLVQMPWSKHQTPIVPLPLLVLGTGLRELQEEGLDFEYDLIDMDFMLKRGELEDSEAFFEAAAEVLAADGADAYFFTTHSPNESIVVQVMEQLKLHRPECICVMGGLVSTLFARPLVEAFPWIDVVIKGEGEPVLGDLVEAAMGDRDFSAVPAAVGRKNGEIFENQRVWVGKREGFLYPDYDLVDLEAYARESIRHPYLFPGFSPVESGRGCGNCCNFCTPAKMWQGRLRYRPVPEIYEEMLFLADYGFKFIFLTQDNVDEKFLRKLCRYFIRQDNRIRWGCYAQLYSLADETIELMAKAGCRHVFVGFEAPDPQIHAFIRKSIDRQESVRTVAKIGAMGVRLIGSFVAGVPGETREQLAETMDFALECAVGLSVDRLRERVRDITLRQLPYSMTHHCVLNPLACNPGTDFYNDFKDQLRFVEATTDEESFGSVIFGANTFVREHWRVVNNACCTLLSEEDHDFYYPVIRVFNAALYHPYFFAWLMVHNDMGMLELIDTLAEQIGRREVMRYTPAEFVVAMVGVLRREWGVRVPSLAK